MNFKKLGKEEYRKWRHDSKKLKFVESNTKELWHIHKLICDRKQQLTDEGNFARMSMAKFNHSNDKAKMML
jgi:hypothetical protein